MAEWKLQTEFEYNPFYKFVDDGTDTLNVDCFYIDIDGIRRKLGYAASEGI